jgi:hypothetical protein
MSDEDNTAALFQCDERIRHPLNKKSTYHDSSLTYQIELVEVERREGKEGRQVGVVEGHVVAKLESPQGAIVLQGLGEQGAALHGWLATTQL